MLNFFSRVAQRLKPYRRGMMVLIAISILTAIYGFTVSGITPHLALQAGLSSTMFWGLLLATTDIFYTVPPLASPEQRWWPRLKRRIVRFFYAGLALLMIFSSLILLSTTHKLFSV